MRNNKNKGVLHFGYRTPFRLSKKTPNTGEANSFPRGEGGPRRGSEEEFGQKLESPHNIADLLQRRMQYAVLEKVFVFPVIERCRPHSSSVRKTVL